MAKRSRLATVIRAVPYVMVVTCGLGVGLSMVFVMMKFKGVSALQSWWLVLLPMLIAFNLTLIAFTIALILWASVARSVCGGFDDDDREHNFRLDVLFRTAKVCFIGHGYTSLLCAALWLLLAKLVYHPKWSVIYPMIPIIILGALHVFMAVMFKSPEVNGLRSGGIGVSLLAHAFTIVFKIEHHLLDPKYPWALIFVPSWLTYAGVLALCIANGASVLSRLASVGTSQNTTTAGRRARNPRKALQSELLVIAGFLIWAIGFSASQMLLAMKLDGHTKDLTWEIIAVPGIVGWVALIIFTATPAARYFGSTIALLAGALGVSIPVPVEERPQQRTLEDGEATERTPFLARLARPTSQSGNGTTH